MIRVNDRLDPMAGLVEIPGAELGDPVGNRRTFTAPQGEFTSRLATAGVMADRFAIAIGDPDDIEEGVAPDMWFGVVQSWQPVGSNMSVVCRPARNVEEIAGALLPAHSGVITPRVGGIG